MENDLARRYDVLADELLAEFDAGPGEDMLKLRAYATHRYLFTYDLPLVLQRRTARVAAPAEIWKINGRVPAPTAQPLIVLFPPSVSSAVLPSRRRPLIDFLLRLLRLHRVVVFDRDDTIELPEFSRSTGYSGDPGPYLEGLKQLIASRKIEIHEVDPVIDPLAVGRSGRGFIAIDATMTPAAQFCVLVHELAHEVLHTGRWTHDGEEIDADVAAFLAGSFVGLGARAALDYLNGLRSIRRRKVEKALRTVRPYVLDVVAALLHGSSSGKIPVQDEAEVALGSSG